MRMGDGVFSFVLIPCYLIFFINRVIEFNIPQVKFVLPMMVIGK